MLNIKLLKRFTSIGLVLAGMAVSSAQAASFNIDFGYKGDLAPDSYGAAAGLAGEGIGSWNKVPGVRTLGVMEPLGLFDLGGNTTDAILEFATPQPAYNGEDGSAASNDERLMNDYFYTRGKSDNWSLSIKGEDITGTYDLYYYAPMGQNVETGAFTVNGTQVSNLSGKRDDRTITQATKGDNWAVLEGVTIGNLGLLLDFQVPANLPGVFHGLSGLQLVESPSPVPLPAGFWLFGTALAGLLGFKKSRKTA